MANRKMNKLDMYAETRLWNLKLKNGNITTDDLVKEMIFRFKLSGGIRLYLKLQQTILSARRRVMRRQTAMKKNIRDWSSQLCLPEKTVAQWAWRGMLTEGNINAVFEVLTTYAYSARYRPLIPIDVGHPFRLIPAGDSGRSRPPIPTEVGR